MADNVMASKESTRYQTVKRGYVACDSCRSRKVRCIIDGEPPCVKCDREHRVCKFDRRPKTTKHRDPPRWASRSTAGTSESEPGPAAHQQEDAAEATRLGVGPPSRPAAEVPPMEPSPQAQGTFGHSLYPGHTPSGSAASDGWRGQTGQTPQTPNTSLSDKVVSAIVTGSHDALDVLTDAAGLRHRGAAPASERSPRPLTGSAGLPTAVPVESQLACHSGIGFHIQTLSEPSEETLDLWDRSRFVRQGFFTGQEAVSYVDLFFKHLAPLSAVYLDQFQDHAAHRRLIHEESMLSCTILLIASRFFMLPGAGGASRSHFIHTRMWHYTEFLIKRIMFGQEKLSTAKTRTVGTVESLILLSEWHPRSLHFPPESEGWDSLLVSPEIERSGRTRKNDEEPSARWAFDVFEPAKRANRMSWMLLGTATNLAHELGIFAPDRSSPPCGQSEDEVRRLYRAQRLLYTHVTQAAIRLGYHSIFPENIVIEASRSQADVPGMESSHRAWNAYMNAWIELTRLSRLASSMFFVSTSHLQRQLMNDNYLDLLDNFSMSLSMWQRNFLDTCQDVSSGLTSTLLIDFHHLKALSGSIAIQAVVQRASNLAPEGHQRGALASFLTSREERFIREVITDSSMVLKLATMSDFKTQLPLAPARTRISVISASVFLLKAISVGATNTDTAAALDILEQSTTTLKSYPPDDMDFAMRYAGLIDKFTDIFRAGLLPGYHSVGTGVEDGQGMFGGHGSDTGLEGVMGPPPVHGAYGTQDLGEDVAMDLEFAPGLQSDFWRNVSFDSSIAPFGTGNDQLSQGLHVDSLDFLWNLPEMG
ncbi:C6 transcription factor [Plectosphaerella plurivora]|uniref:C6 transcription factor n=1 Tax=Plectosphaerella plurivora TaxID=936078 RepID=A0A9P8VE70_9PEZI|nr:C6 transcription factor [Plectosphaerella plurivora]